MEFFHKHSLPLLLFILQMLCFKSIGQALNSNVTALLVFGDSTVDPGNNNNIRTIFKANFPPYGREFANHTPTGRFSDGQLTTDFVASYLGIKKYIPPYLDQTLSIQELVTGVSFASGASGYDPLTPTLSNVIPMSKQLDYFREYKKKIEPAIGNQGIENHINNAVFVISAGTNDFVVNYYTVPVRRQSYNVSSYQQFLLQQVKEFIQGLWDEGARKIAVSGLPPMGCLPIVDTFSSNNTFTNRSCIEQYSSVARDYNQMLQTELDEMQQSSANHGAKIYYIDIYGPLFDMVQYPEKYGYEEVNVGCCGSGYVETSILCNQASTVCTDASKYVFWDAIHPTEMAYNVVFKDIRSTIDLITSGILSPWPPPHIPVVTCSHRPTFSTLTLVSAKHESVAELLSSLSLHDCCILFAGLIPSRSSSQASAPIDIHLPRLGKRCITFIDLSFPSRLGSSSQELEISDVSFVPSPAPSPPIKLAHTFPNIAPDAA